MSRNPNAGQEVLKAVHELYATGRRAHRDDIVLVTGFRLSIVDDHLKRLKLADKVRLIERSVYAPIESLREDRAMSYTILPGGLRRKIEIGECVIDDITPSEARMLCELLGGAALAYIRPASVPGMASISAR